MTYSSRGRSLTELIIAVVFIGFLTGFVAVLCIGNYFRAKRAMERQRQRRLANKLAGHADTDFAAISPKSNPSSEGSDEHMHLLSNQQHRRRLPDLPRRRAVDDNAGTDLLLSESTQQAVNVMSV